MIKSLCEAKLANYMLFKLFWLLKLANKQYLTVNLIYQIQLIPDI